MPGEKCLQLPGGVATKLQLFPSFNFLKYCKRYSGNLWDREEMFLASECRFVNWACAPGMVLWLRQWGSQSIASPFSIFFRLSNAGACRGYDRILFSTVFLSGEGTLPDNWNWSTMEQLRRTHYVWLIVILTIDCTVQSTNLSGWLEQHLHPGLNVEYQLQSAEVRGHRWCSFAVGALHSGSAPVLRVRRVRLVGSWHQLAFSTLYFFKMFTQFEHLWTCLQHWFYCGNLWKELFDRISLLVSTWRRLSVDTLVPVALSVGCVAGEECDSVWETWALETRQVSWKTKTKTKNTLTNTAEERSSMVSRDQACVRIISHTEVVLTVDNCFFFLSQATCGVLRFFEYVWRLLRMLTLCQWGFVSPLRPYGKRSESTWSQTIEWSSSFLTWVHRPAKRVL